MPVSCPVAGTCSGCPWIPRAYESQLADKRDALRAAWTTAGLDAGALGELPIDSAGKDGLRDRTDLLVGGDVLGLYGVDGDSVVGVGACPALSPALRAWVAVVQADMPPMARATLRFRVAPDGARGLWIDAANADVKTLMDEDAWLGRRLGDGVVEIGQRRKPLARVDGRLRLGKQAELRPWFQTWLDGERSAPLYGPIGGFSQPSHAANRLLVRRVLELAGAARATPWLELGSGSGNLTLPLAAAGHDVVAVEVDAIACDGLARAAVEAGVADRVRVAGGNMHRDDGSLRRLMVECDAILADPPRSGVGASLDALAGLSPAERPRAFLYVSCYLDALARDAVRLAALGYRATRAIGVDQFPQTAHCEWLVLFQR